MAEATVRGADREPVASLDLSANTRLTELSVHDATGSPAWSRFQESRRPVLLEISSDVDGQGLRPVSTVERDEAGRVTAFATGGGRSVRFSYDAQGNPAQVWDADQLAATYEYDADGRLAQAYGMEWRITWSYGEAALNLEYDDSGNISAATQLTGTYPGRYELRWKRYVGPADQAPAQGLVLEIGFPALLATQDPTTVVQVGGMDWPVSLDGPQNPGMSRGVLTQFLW